MSPDLNLLSINPYNEGSCRAIVANHFESNIKLKFGSADWVVLDYRKIYSFDDDIHRRGTPRLGIITSVVPCASFYYLNYLTELNPEKIADIGCGMNFFKDVLPNLIGIDNTKEADVQDHFDQEFSVGHSNHYECAFSIDSLHFVPITTFKERILQFANTIQPGGRGYIAMNVARLIEATPKPVILELFDTVSPSLEKLAHYIDCEIKKIPLQFLVVDNLIQEHYDESMDGNIRLVFEKEIEK